MKYLNRILFGFQSMPFMDAAGDGGSGGGAGGGDNGSSGQGTEEAGDGVGAGEGKKTLDDVLKENKDFQSELDRRIAKALETQKSKLETELKEKLEAEKSEAARLAKLSAEERAKEEFKKEQDEFAQKKTAFERESMELETTKILAGKKLPVDFARFLMAGTADDTKANVEQFEKAFGEAIEAAVTERLKGNPPKGGGGSGGGTVQDEIKAKMFGGKK